MTPSKSHNSDSESVSGMTSSVFEEPRGSANRTEFEMWVEHCSPQPDIGRKFATFSFGPRLCAAVGAVADHRSQLFPSENAYVSNAVLKRQIEFSSGRHYAREALRKLGHPNVEIKTTSARAPLWPDGIIGSISHSEQIAAAIVGYRGRIYRGIGLDVEKKGRVTNDLLPLISTKNERTRLELTADDNETSTVVFSAKEAVYKAINPIAGLMIDFRDVEIAIEGTSKTFKAKYLGNCPQNSPIESGFGRFMITNDYVFSLFFII